MKIILTGNKIREQIGACQPKGCIGKGTIDVMWLLMGCRWNERGGYIVIEVRRADITSRQFIGRRKHLGLLKNSGDFATLGRPLDPTQEV